ncbi:MULTISPECIES: hypothetical protein [Chryseobacterium]|uniref:NVEALA protein n=1 Tax=Chryseobacterium camelliae TaxID=1265445 RepID=A0ABU0TEK0_9FLAO|nr:MULTISPECIES: hypothetical protein [Chryseobacterium]MDT3406716.1 hypothetical protein [Pseudacidovorax intermedius]MDQ1095487.1 hypothetical protein [Chryseobacterium camelliae]MDQ1099424.1 hypothetical protein [Chryseobacterium sp. SORGH_AS_1048]MDR6086770.1 hypothetical protein [Chryseobacterium sp. SORGH_AS_0909]MDR6131143.1 hypothetical protein [Chryseobacterium sp. SORGH_AS_1175]
MRKIILFSAIIFAGSISAKNNMSNHSVSEEANQQIFSLTRYLVTIKTVCGTMYQTVFDSESDSDDCLYNEWEMYNNRDCGHTSYENPIT